MWFLKVRKDTTKNDKGVDPSGKTSYKTINFERSRKFRIQFTMEVTFRKEPERSVIPGRKFLGATPRNGSVMK